MDERYQNQRRRVARTWHRRNELGKDARCYVCGNRNPDYSGLRKATQEERSLIEAHHPAGLHQGDTINLCVYCHLVMTNFQYDWPTILLAKDRNERMELAAICKGMADVYRFMAEQCEQMSEGLIENETAGESGLEKREEEIW